MPVKVSDSLRSGEMIRRTVEAVNTGWRQLGDRLVQWLSINSPSYLGTYKGSHYHFLRVGKSAEGLPSLVVTSSDPAALWKDRGRGPGKAPPPDNILGWVKFKGLGGTPQKQKQIAFAIGQKIAREGTKGARLYDRVVIANQAVIDDAARQIGGSITSAINRR